MNIADIIKTRKPDKGIDLGGYIVDDPETIRTRELRFERIHQIVRQHFIELPANQLEARGRQIAHAGQLYDRFDAVVVDGDTIINTGPTAFYVDGHEFRFLARVGSITQLEQRAEEREHARAEAARQKREQFASLPRRPLTIGDLEGKDLPTAAEAVRRIEEYGGTITARDGELIIELAEKGIPDRGRVVNAARVLFAAQSLVLEALASSGGLATLPDEPVRAGGGVG